MTESNPEVTEQKAPTSLLLVDDEMNILTSLRRLFRPQGYTVHMAQSAREGLDILEKEHIDLVLSDMRMPEMDGAAFLEKVAEYWPDTIRILLTGYSDLNATIAAITRGRIYKYISKPWEDNDLLITIRHALDRKHLEQERKRLAKLTLRQNRELKELNRSLEEKVDEKTRELQHAMSQLQSSHESLKKNYFSTIRVFSDLIEMREGQTSGRARRVADLARKIADKMKLSMADVQNTFVSALLHGIGKIPLADHLIKKPITSLTEQEYHEYQQYALLAESILEGLEPLKKAAGIIHSHLEHYDGTGFPDGLIKHAIPTSSRILAVVSDYESLRDGSYTGKPLSYREAIAHIEQRSGTIYDPDVVRVLKKIPRDELHRKT